MSFAPGEEAQVDFGDIGFLDVGGERRNVWLFAMTLCFSRYSYYELVLDQTVPFPRRDPSRLRALGGVPACIKPDNLRSAVLISSLGERHYQRTSSASARHYG